jgi:6-phosphogluconate dehydrogenase
MKLGMVGLGRMGANMTERLINGGHKVVCYDQNPATVRQAMEKKAFGADSLKKLAEQLSTPRIVWIMVPSGAPVDQTIENIVPHLSPGDIIIDGGNSNYNETIRRGNAMKARNLHYVDVGVSGGIWGLKEGYSMMIGGDKEIVERLKPIFETLAPAPDQGWGYVGPSGAGHYVKMIHNGIEYGMMEAYAEGFAILQAKKNFNLDLHQVAEIWRKGSVVRSWLLDLTSEALAENPDLKGIAPYVVDSGEGRWTVFESIDLDVPAPVITLSLMQRFSSRLEDSFADKLLAAQRNKFGGHAVKRED